MLLLNNEQMNYNTNIACHERTGYITLNMMDCFYVVQNNDVFKQNQPVAHISYVSEVVGPLSDHLAYWHGSPDHGPDH